MLVVGGRTTGLFLGAELARHGVPVRVIDASPGIDPRSRATLLHSRTLEIFEQLGLAATVAADAQEFRGKRVYIGHDLVHHHRFDPVPSPYPFGLCKAQFKIERILEDYLESLGVSVERGTRLTGFTQSDGQVTVDLLHGDGGSEQLQVPWLIGCDGAHSKVRHLLDEDFPGEPSTYPYLLADVAVTGDVIQDEACMYLHDEGDLYMLPLDEGRRLVVANSSPQTDTEQPLSLADIQALVDRRSGGGFTLADPRWISYFHIHYRLSPHYRHGRVFLAGDAAHIHSLIGGHGMNMGIQDGWNLAWKIALVQSGAVPARWLDSYEAERRKVAAGVIEASRVGTELGERYGGLDIAARARLLEQLDNPAARELSVRMHDEEIDLDYSDSPLSGEGQTGFARGPKPGHELVNAGPLLVAGISTDLLALSRGTKHTLLVAPGVAMVAADCVALVNRVVGEWGDWIDACLVNPQGDDELLPQVIAIDDDELALVGEYGLEQGGYYLLRPDGYVACRGRGLDEFEAYMRRVLG